MFGNLRIFFEGELRMKKMIVALVLTVCEYFSFETNRYYTSLHPLHEKS